MEDIKGLLRQIVNLSDEDKMLMIRDSYLELMPLFREIDPDTEGLSFLSKIIGTASAADGRLDPTELLVMKTVMEASDLDLTDEELEKLVRDSGTEEAHDLVARLAKLLPPEHKAQLVLLTALVCSMNDRITAEEIRLITSLAE